MNAEQPSTSRDQETPLNQASVHNLLEPPAFARLFARHPPVGFTCRSGLVPAFRTDFNLLTTLEKSARERLARLPFAGVLPRLLTVPACFAGSTITEYAPLPATDPEILLAALLKEHAGEGTLTILKDLPLDSPLLTEEENAFSSRLAALAVARGFFEVKGQALAYVPVDFGSIEAYLARLSAARRKDLRRKLKKRVQLDVEAVPFGAALLSNPAFLGEMYAMYQDVFAQSDIHFDLLTPEFFAALLQDHRIGGLVFLYRRQGELAGYNICLLHNGMLIDKYIGFRYSLARDLNLYFISWMINLEFALENGLRTYIAGWTDPEVKASLGASFTFTRHLVWVKNPLLRRILRPLRHFFESDGKALRGA